MANILVTGSAGQLGSELRRIVEFVPINHNFFFTDVAELDITSGAAVEDFIAGNSIDLVINCAAYTNVDKAEEPENRDAVYRLNAEAPALLASCVRHRGGAIIHISTDYVFGGVASEPYREGPAGLPARSVYGESKRQGELGVASACPDFVIVRTAWLYSSFGHNFVKTVLRLAGERDLMSVVDDQKGSPTYARDLAGALLTIAGKVICYAGEQKKSAPTGAHAQSDASAQSGASAQSETYGLSGVTEEECAPWGYYHYSNGGECTWFELASEIVKINNLPMRVVPVTSDQYPSKVARPAYSVLDKSKIISKFGLVIPDWRDSLRDCLSVIGGE